jgi:RNA polymerase sigma factor (sigma-70 family)
MAAIITTSVLPRERCLPYSGYDVKTASAPSRKEAESRVESFTSTRWTMVLEAGDSATASAHALSALSELCQIYWRPLYAFLRRQGYGAEDAQDLTQGFFAHLIETRAYAHADREKGRFRSFLLGALKYFVAHARDHDRAQKRGGRFLLVQLDEAALAEAETHAARFQNWSAEGVFEREWAASLLRQALDRLAQEYAVAGKGALFEALKVHLKASAAATVPYEEMAKRLGRQATTLRSDVARLRARYRAILREEVSGTLADPRDVDQELRHLRQAMAA